MKEHSGRQFDSVLLERFVDILPQLLTIRERYGDEEEEPAIAPASVAVS